MIIESNNNKRVNAIKAQSYQPSGDVKENKKSCNFCGRDVQWDRMIVGGSICVASGLISAFVGNPIFAGLGIGAGGAILLYRYVTTGVKEISYGDFSNKDIVFRVLEHLKKESKEYDNFLSTSKSFWCLKVKRIILTVKDILERQNVKVRLALENDIKTHIHLENNDDFQRMINFLEKPNNENLLNNVDAISVGSVWSAINSSNQVLVQQLINHLGKYCPSLSSFSISISYVSLDLKPLSNLRILECDELGNGAEWILEGLPNLIKVNFGPIYRNAALKLINLNKLESFSFTVLDNKAVLTLEDLPNLSSVFCNMIHADTTLKLINLSKLSSLIFQDLVQNGANLSFENLPKIKQLFFGKVEGDENRKKLESLI